MICRLQFKGASLSQNGRIRFLNIHAYDGYTFSVCLNPEDHPQWPDAPFRKRCENRIPSLMHIAKAIGLDSINCPLLEWQTAIEAHRPLFFDCSVTQTDKVVAVAERSTS